jgi:hypothetical protein
VIQKSAFLVPLFGIIHTQKSASRPFIYRDFNQNVHDRKKSLVYVPTEPENSFSIIFKIEYSFQSRKLFSPK